MEINRLLATIELIDDWRAPYLEYLARGKPPTHRDEARCLHGRAKSFVLIDGELYKRSISGIIQRCIPTMEGILLLKDVHRGICGH